MQHDFESKLYVLHFDGSSPKPPGSHRVPFLQHRPGQGPRGQPRGGQRKLQHSGSGHLFCWMPKNRVMKREKILNLAIRICYSISIFVSTWSKDLTRFVVLEFPSARLMINWSKNWPKFLLKQILSTKNDNAFKMGYLALSMKFQNVSFLSSLIFFLIFNYHFSIIYHLLRTKFVYIRNTTHLFFNAVENFHISGRMFF